MNRNIWLEKKQSFLETEIRFQKLPKSSDNKSMIRFLWIIGFISILSYANAQCPDCDKEIQCKRLWGDTWICPDADCGYENYEEIEYCGICGTWRYQK